ncbi:helix-turn-helix domain-containing protein [Actinoplanes sp. NPDC049802]|uniref:PucR family transcriptional regulator n=1 Tax=Actinoplanes sp. NPDC049802 TaxID=3154742 RepID=UPI0033E5BA8B
MPHGWEYLDLIAREAAAVDFERPLVAARAAGLSGAELAELEQAKTKALRVRALLEHRRRREEEVERAAAAHERMTSVVLRGRKVGDVAAELVNVLPGALLVIDAEGRALATAASPGRVAPPGPGDTAVSAAVAASRSEGRSVRRGELIIAAVVAGADDLGALVFRPDRPLSEMDQRLVECAAQMTALLLLFRRTVADAEAQVRGDLLDELISRPVRDPAAAHSRAARLGLDLDAPYVVVAAGDDTGDSLGQRAISWARTIAATRRGLALTRDDRIALLLPGDDPADTARLVARELSRTATRPVTAGGAGPFRGAAAVAPAHREAGRCLSALITLGRAGTGAGTAELGYVGLLLADRRDVTGFVQTLAGPVIDYDARRGTALIRTLEAYFDAGGALVRAAEALHVHVNTVTQRLERVTQLLGDGWDEPRRVLDLQLALRLHRLRGPLRTAD